PKFVQQNVQPQQQYFQAVPQSNSFHRPQQYYYYSQQPHHVQYAPPPVQYIRDKPMKFDGNTKQVKVKHWMMAYELYTEGLSDRDKVTKLAFFVEKDALAWYGN